MAAASYAMAALGSVPLGLRHDSLGFFSKKICYFLGETFQTLSSIDVSTEAEPSRQRVSSEETNY